MLALSMSMRVMSRSSLFKARTSNAGAVRRGMSSNGSNAFSTVADFKLQAPVVHAAFDIKDDSFVSEYGVKATLYTHKKTGAELMSLKAKDENKVFGITFRTPPTDSTGIPHILEHSVLCGSRKFPVKEPFVDMLKGSLQNFLNAFTYPDRTCYPVASTNIKDFYNLVHVYMDAVLFPRAISDKKVFDQEGWHYELEDPSQPLTYKGVVYNEMKGVYSSADSILDRETQRVLFPDNAYGVDSGGDPKVIPQLTFEQFQQFHSKYYHPSNSRIFFYGDDDVSKRLDLMDEYLNLFDRKNLSKESSSEVAFQRKWKTVSKPHNVLVPFAKGSDGKQAVTVNWVLNDKHLSSKDMLALVILDHLLMGTPASSLRKILTDSQLGESVMGGMSTELIQAVFSVGMKGIQDKKNPEVEKLILDTLTKLSEEGFHADAITASINTIEFRLREFNTGSFPRGLDLMLGMLQGWIYDQSPVEHIRFQESLDAIKADIAAGRPLFQNLLKEYFVGNNHRVTMNMIPDKGVEETTSKDEVDRLAAVKSKMTPEQLQQIIDYTATLKAAQLAEDTPEARATLPKLSLSDIDPKARELPIAVDSNSHPGVTVLTHSVPSNGILYCDVVFNLNQIAQEDLAILSLFSRLLTESGTASLGEVELSRKIGSETGGISASSYLNRKRSPGGRVSNIDDDALLYLMLHGKATAEKVDVLFRLMTDILLHAKLDNRQKAIDFLKESKVAKQAAVVTRGNAYGSTRIGSMFTLVGYINEQMSGLTSVRAASELLALAETNWPALQKRLEGLRSKFLLRDGIVINLTGDDRTLAAANAELTSFLQSIPQSVVTDALGSSSSSIQESKSNSIRSNWIQQQQQNKDAKLEFTVPKVHEGFIIPSQVNYVCHGGPIFSPGEEVKGSASVLVRNLGTGYLWDNVRVVGGAYGGGATFSDASGLFTFRSYRDPNLVQTLQVYDQTADHVLNESLSQEELLQAVIGAVGDLDAPLTAEQKGFSSMVEYLTGDTYADRQKWRDEVLSTRVEDFHAIAQRLQKLKTEGVTVVFGSETALKTANEQLEPHQRLKVEQAYVGQKADVVEEDEEEGSHDGHHH